jgi:anti-sigma B factor antagonist
MTVQERAIGSVVVLDLGGRLVLGDGDGLLKERVNALLKQGTKHVVLNLADVSYVDSSGLGALVGTFLTTRNEGGAMKLLSPSKRLHDLLAMAKLLKVLDICDSEAQALDSFGGSLA